MILLIALLIFSGSFIYLIMILINYIFKNLWSNVKPTILYILYLILMILILYYGI